MTLATKLYHAGLYSPQTQLALIECIENELALVNDPIGFHRQQKLTIKYGHPWTGKAWIDEPVTGFLLLVGGELVLQSSKRGKTAQVVLTHFIVRISSGAETKYRHPLYHEHTEKPPTVIETKPAQRAVRRISFSRSSDGSS